MFIGNNDKIRIENSIFYLDSFTCSFGVVSSQHFDLSKYYGKNIKVCLNESLKIKVVDANIEDDCFWTLATIDLSPISRYNRLIIGTNKKRNIDIDPFLIRAENEIIKIFTDSAVYKKDIDWKQVNNVGILWIGNNTPVAGESYSVIVADNKLKALAGIKFHIFKNPS